MLKDVIAAAEGNEAVREFLQLWLDEAGKGEIVFCAGVFSRSPTDVRTGQAGVIGTEFAINYGLDDLKASVRRGLEERKSPPQKRDAAANRAMYNLIQGACSFDFLPWLIQAEMRRVREGAPAPLRVGFYLGKNNDRARALSTPQREQAYHGIMLPLVELLGGVVDADAIDGRQDGTLSFAPVFDACKRGEAIPQLQLPAQIQTEINDAIMEACGQRPVTITLREAEHFPHRNSNLPEWIKFAQWLEGHGEKVLFVRDTAKSREPMPELDEHAVDDFRTCPPASENLFARVALYAQARANLFVSNGPAVLALIMDRPYLMFQTINNASKYWPEQAEGWRHFTGVEPGGQWPIAKADQRIIWTPDTFEHIRDAWLAHIAVSEAAAA